MINTHMLSYLQIIAQIHVQFAQKDHRVLIYNITNHNYYKQLNGLTFVFCSLFKKLFMFSENKTSRTTAFLFKNL